MHDQPMFLTFLGVPFDADERVIRRAYATLLKQIDQASEADKFQQLREAYEAALAWVREGEHPSVQSVPEYGPAALPVQLKMPGEVSSGDAAASALLGFLMQVETCRSAGSLTMDEMVDALNAALASDALVDLDARELFEAQLALRLAQGWGPGDLLFPAASRLLGWRDDRQHLRGLCAAGAFLDRAIDQQAIFEGQSQDDIAMQHAVLAQLRKTDLPDEQFLRTAFPGFEKLVYYMPQWLAVVTPREQVARWREHYTNVLGCEPGSSFVKVPAPVVPFDLWKRITIPLIILGLTVLVFVSTGVKSPDSGLSIAEVNRQMEQAAAVGPHVPPPAPLSAELPEDFRQQIYARIHYAGTSKLVQGVTFEIALTDNGRIVMLRKLASSGDEGFDAAVGQALTASQPFPPNLRSTMYVGIDPGKIPEPDPKP